MVVKSKKRSTKPSANFHKKAQDIAHLVELEEEAKLKKHRARMSDREPSKVKTDEWLWAERKVGSYTQDTATSGKWLIFVATTQVDRVWSIIKQATQEGKLGNIAKVSTAKRISDSRPNRHVICVYTYNWKDETDVHRIRAVLRELSITWKISYKADSDTIRGKYASHGDQHIAKYVE